MTSQIINSSVSKDISHGGFRPELFTVGAGTYASNHVYGSGIALVNTYTPQSLSSLSRASIRQHDRDVDYSLKITLDLSLADPAFNNEELRIRTLQPLGATDSGAYLKKIPVKSVNYRQPLFLDVEVINPATGAPFAGFPVNAGIGQLQARLLISGELALVVADLTAGPPPTVQPLTALDLAPIFGAGAGTQLQISVRGSYRGENSP